jgi:hypothetical protein
MTNDPGLLLKKAFNYALIGSVGIGAALGILAVLSGRWGWLEIRVILTTLVIAATSVCGLACSACLATQRARVLPTAGLILSLIAAAILLAQTWTIIDLVSSWKLATCASVLAVACAHLSLLSMVRLAERFSWALLAAHLVVLGTAFLIVMMLTGGFESGFFPVIGVAAILDAAISILIPTLGRLSRLEPAEDPSGAPAAALADLDAEIKRLRERLAELERLRYQHLS